jgi:hypothetical protein
MPKLAKSSQPLPGSHHHHHLWPQPTSFPPCHPSAEATFILQVQEPSQGCPAHSGSGPGAQWMLTLCWLGEQGMPCWLLRARSQTHEAHHPDDGNPLPIHRPFPRKETWYHGNQHGPLAQMASVQIPILLPAEYPFVCHYLLPSCKTG